MKLTKYKILVVVSAVFGALNLYSAETTRFNWPNEGNSLFWEEGDFKVLPAITTSNNGSYVGREVKVYVTGDALLDIDYEAWCYKNRFDYENNNLSKQMLSYDSYVDQNYFKAYVPTTWGSSGVGFRGIKIKAVNNQVSRFNDAQLTLTINDESTTRIFIRDNDQGDYSYLVNLSSRGYLKSGSVFNGGMVIRGAEPKQIIVVASGPRLGQIGVTDTLENPLLVLYKGGSELARNDNWNVQTSPSVYGNGLLYLETDQNLIGDAIDATGMNSSQLSLDSALLVTLEPGVYLFRVYATSGSSPEGNTMISINDLDGI